MTASRAQRRRSMVIGLVAGVLALVATSVLGYVATSAMIDSEEGRDATPDSAAVTTQRLPWTSTALIGVVDGDGQLTSSVIAILEPDNRGGTIIAVSPSADVGSGLVDRIRPLRAIFEVDGADAWRASLELMTGMAFDVAEVVDAQRFGQLVSPLGELPTRFPYAFTDSRTDRTYEVGDQVLSVREASAVVTARNDGGSPSRFDGARNSVWEAVADRVGAGIGSLPEGVRFDERASPAGLDQFLDALFTAPVEFRALEIVAPDDPDDVADRIDDDYAAAMGSSIANDVVFHRRAEIAMVFGSLAPARIGAPLEGPTIRLVSGFIDDDAAPFGLNRSDLIAAALDVFFFSQSNVVAVVDQPGAAVPDATRLLVADPTAVDDVWDLYPEAFGEIQVLPDDVPIEGVAIEVTLGRDFLRVLAEQQAAAADGAADAEGGDDGDTADGGTVDGVAGTDE